MNIKLEYNARHKRTQYPLFSGEVHLHITKKEARFIARRYFIWERTIERLDFPYDYDAIEMVLEKALRKLVNSSLRSRDYAVTNMPWKSRFPMIRKNSLRTKSSKTTLNIF